MTLIFDLWPWPWVKKAPRGVECLYEWWIQSAAPCWCSSQKSACGGGGGDGGGARRGPQYPFGPNGPRGKIRLPLGGHHSIFGGGGRSFCLGQIIYFNMARRRAEFSQFYYSLCRTVSEVNYLLFIHPKLFISKVFQHPPPPWDLMMAPLLSTNFEPTAVSMLQNRKGAMLRLYTGMYVVSSGLLVSWYSMIASTSIMVTDTKCWNRRDNSQA